jgi:hypothetical protein
MIYCKTIKNSPVFVPTNTPGNSVGFTAGVPNTTGGFFLTTATSLPTNSSPSINQSSSRSNTLIDPAATVLEPNGSVATTTALAPNGSSSTATDLVPNGSIPTASSTVNSFASDSDQLPLSTLLAILIPSILALLLAFGLFMFYKRRRTQNNDASGGDPQILVSENTIKSEIPHSTPNMIARGSDAPTLPPLVAVAPLMAGTRAIEKKPSDIMEYQTINDITDMYSSMPATQSGNSPIVSKLNASTDSVKRGTTLKSLAASAGITAGAGLVSRQSDEEVTLDTLDRVHASAKRTVDSDDIIQGSTPRWSFRPEESSEITSIINLSDVEPKSSISSSQKSLEMKQSNSIEKISNSVRSEPSSHHIKPKSSLSLSSSSSVKKQSSPVERMPDSLHDSLYSIPGGVQQPISESRISELTESDFVSDESKGIGNSLPSNVVDSASYSTSNLAEEIPIAGKTTALGVGLSALALATQKENEKHVHFDYKPQVTPIGKISTSQFENGVKRNDAISMDKKAPFPVGMMTDTPGRFELTKHVEEEDEMDDLENYAPPAPTSHVVFQAYYPQNSDEMLLQMGDLIGIEKEYGDGWARGQNISQRRKRCVFPLAILKPITSGPSQAVRRGRGNVFRASQRDSSDDKAIEIPKRSKSIRRLRKNTRNSSQSIRSNWSYSSQESK